jgi:hypothetical protein
VKNGQERKRGGRTIFALAQIAENSSDPFFAQCEEFTRNRKRGVTMLVHRMIGLGVKGCLFLWFAVATAFGEDIALNKPVSSNNQNYHPATYAVDGDWMTHWGADTYATTSAPIWLTVDLEGTYSLDRVFLYLGPYNPDFAGYTNEYKLRVSDNAVDWSDVASGVLIDSPVFTEVSNEIHLTDVNAHYVQYYVFGGSHWAHLGAIEAYGSPVPEPSTLVLLGIAAVALFAGRKRGWHGKGGEKGISPIINKTGRL